MEGSGRIVNAIIVGGDHHISQISSLYRPLIDMLKDGLTGECGESFSWESAGGKPGGYHAQNSLRHKLG